MLQGGLHRSTRPSKMFFLAVFKRAPGARYSHAMTRWGATRTVVESRRPDLRLIDMPEVCEGAEAKDGRSGARKGAEAKGGCRLKQARAGAG
jgi:hypothetical protein